MAEPAHLAIGHIAKAHGIRGEVYVSPLTDRPEEAFAPGREVLLGDAEGGLGDSPATLRIERARAYRRGLLVGFEGYGERNAVEPLVRRYLLRPVEELEPLAEDELFYHQLLGAEVVTAEGRPVGRVREVYESEPADLLEVKGEGGRLHLIPFTRQIVKDVDREAGRVVIDPPPGLLDV